jgi:hypothetical protein
LINDEQAPADAPIVTDAPDMGEQVIQQIDAPITLEEFLHDAGNTPENQLETINSDIANYKKVILDLEQKGGAYEAGLSEELLALASLYQKTGEFGEAQKILNRAAHIARVNNGLFDAAQIPLLKKVIDNYVQLGDLAAADEQQAALFYMQKKLYGESSPELLPGLKYFAEWNLFAATTNIGPPPVTESESGEKPIVDIATFQFEHLVAAEALYDHMAKIVMKHPDLDDTHLAQAENQLLAISHLFATRYNPYITSFDVPSFSGFSSSLSPVGGSFLGSNDMGYRNGIDILEARVERLQKQPTPDARKLAEAKIALADWLLVFDRRVTALEELEEIYQDLVDAAVAEHDLNALLNPAIPEEIPKFRNYRYSRASLGIPEDLNLQYKGYVDVEFHVNRAGRASSITILGTSPDTDDEIPNRLVNHLRYAQLRPRVQAGSVKTEDLYQLRYHYTY